jgi:hypothetical protein
MLRRTSRSESGRGVLKRGVRAIGLVVFSLSFLSVAPVAPASAQAGEPAHRDLRDIDIATVTAGRQVVVGLTWDGEVLAIPILGLNEEVGDWVSLGTGFKRVYVEAIERVGTGSDALIVGLRNSGEVWHTTIDCTPVCLASGWENLGGNLTQLRIGNSHLFHCVELSGLAPSHNVYEARVCDETREASAYGWRYAGGKLAELGGVNFGVTNSGAVWHRPAFGTWQTWVERSPIR